MPTRLTYWTGVWEPWHEAISSQVETLRRALAPTALVVSLAMRQRLGFDRHARVVRMPARLWPLLRLLAPLLERRGQVTHLTGGLGSWHLLRCLGRRPLVFTVALAGSGLDQKILERVTRFVVETEQLRSKLRQMGVDESRITLVNPGIDLQRFRFLPPPPEGPFRILFASTPADPREMEARGLPLLVELCHRVPEVEAWIPWRTWGDVDASRRHLANLDPPPNFRVSIGEVSSMETMYAEAHAVACCYAEGFGKACPHSLIEGLAVGRPSLMTDTVSVASIIAGAGAGVAAPRTVDGLVDAVERLRRDYSDYHRRSRELAEERYDRSHMIEAYCRIYSDLARVA